MTSRGVAVREQPRKNNRKRTGFPQCNKGKKLQGVEKEEISYYAIITYKLHSLAALNLLEGVLNANVFSRNLF